MGVSDHALASTPWRQSSWWLLSQRWCSRFKAKQIVGGVCYISELEILHVLLFVTGIFGDGKVPLMAVIMGCTGLALLMLLCVDVPTCWRHEHRYVGVCCRELTLVTLAFYVDSVAVYMVAVLHERRMENIALQDNVQLFLVSLFQRAPMLEAIFLRVPEFYAEEAIVLGFTLGFVALAMQNGRRFSYLAALSRVAKTVRWCRLLRVLCYTSTVMPSQTLNCFLNRYDETLSFSEHWREALLHWRGGGGCNDLVFSGHGSTLALSALVYSTYQVQVGIGAWLPVLLWCRVVHASLRIVHSHFHMSVDLVLSLIVTCFLWHLIPHPQPDSQEPSLNQSTDGKDEPVDDLESMAKHLPNLPRCSRRVSCQEGSLVLTAIAGLSLLAWQADPLSDYNRRRMHSVMVGETASNSHSLSLGTGPDGQRPRIFCAMLHIEQSRAARQAYAEAVTATWGSRCDGLVLWDEQREDVAPLNAEAASEEPIGDSGFKDRWLRTRRMWRYIARDGLQHFDWFVAVDDGGFVVPENLLRAVAAFSSSNGGHSSQPLYLVNQGPDYAPWGYVLNAAAAKQLLKALDAPSEQCPAPSRARTGDLLEVYGMVYSCLHSAQGVPVHAWEDNSQVRQALGCLAHADGSVVNLKVRSEPTQVCRHAVLAYMVPNPRWMWEVFNEIYGKNGTAPHRGDA